MKQIRSYILLGCMVMATGSILAFTNLNSPDPEGGATCHLTITYEEDGQTVVLDTTFTCSGALEVQSFIDELNLPEDTRVECRMECVAGSGSRMGGKSCSRMASAKNVEVIEGVDKDGNKTMKIMVDGKEIDLGGENVLMLKHGEREGSDDDGETQMKVMVIETEDDNGKRVIKKCVRTSKQCKMKCCSNPQPGCCAKGAKWTSDAEGSEHVFVKIIEEDGVTKKCVVIIQTMDDEDETLLMREAPETVPNLEKSELAVSGLVFSPNPNDGHFNLSFELGENTPAKIAVYSMEGRKVYSKKIKQPEGVFSEDIDISKYGSGTYFLQITQGDKAQTKKVVIQ